MGTSFCPNETIVESFRRMARGARPKLKAYLLKRAGISTHDIRVIPSAKQAVRVSQPDPFAAAHDSPYYRFFNRTLSNAPFFVVNASDTSPALLELHYFLEVAESSCLLLYSDSTTHQSLALQHSFLASSGSLNTFSIPHLQSGQALYVGPDEFGVGIRFPVDSDVAHKLGNERDYRPPDDLLNECQLAFESLPKTLTVWVGLVLSSEELLPYRWDQETERYVPGFFSDSTVVPS